jgi:hypothetical protein
MRTLPVAFVCFVVASAITPFPAYAQGNIQARLAALEDRVAKLEGRISAEDLVGRYRVTGLITDLDGGPPASVTMYAVAGVLRLDADGTGFIRQRGGAINLVEGSPWTDDAAPLPRERTDITWDYASGVLHITDGTPNLDLNLNVGAGGRVLTSAGLSDDNTADLFIGTRLR